MFRPFCRVNAAFLSSATSCSLVVLTRCAREPLSGSGAERGHSCPQQCVTPKIASKRRARRTSGVAADRNVRAPPAVTDRLHRAGFCACQKAPRRLGIRAKFQRESWVFNENNVMYRIIGADNKEYGPITTEQLRQW